MKQLYRFCFVRKDLCSVRLKKEVVRVPYHEYNIIPLLGQCDKETCKHTLSNVEWLYYMNMRVDLVHLCGYKGMLNIPASRTMVGLIYAWPTWVRMGCRENKMRH